MTDEHSGSSSSFSSISTSEGVVNDDTQTVKGLTFGTIRTYLIENHGEAGWEAFLAKLPRRSRTLLNECEFTEWYPETELRRIIHALHEHLAEGDDERFMELCRGIALAGISRFFRMVLTLASAKFVLRNIPTFWKRLRRGPARVTVETVSDSLIKIHYSDYRYCRDPLYRLLSLANCQAGVYAATKQIPKSEVESWTGDSMTLVFHLGQSQA